jgi:hypothetical protein
VSFAYWGSLKKHIQTLIIAPQMQWQANLDIQRELRRMGGTAIGIVSLAFASAG